MKYQDDEQEEQKFQAFHLKCVAAFPAVNALAYACYEDDPQVWSVWLEYLEPLPQTSCGDFQPAALL